MSLVAVALFATNLGIAGAVPLMDDEVYYWAWTRELQLSYYDHPPMVAYAMAVSTRMFGNAAWAVRLPSCLALAVVWWLIVDWMRPRTLWPAIAALPVFLLGAILATPDAMLMLFWTAYARWLVAVHRTIDRDAGGPSWALWLLGGVILGGGGLSKYTMAISVPIAFISLALYAGRRWPRWLPGFLLHGLVALAITSPIVIYNIQHDWAGLRFQWQHSMGERRWSLTGFCEFAGLQVLLFGTMTVWLLPWVIRNLYRWRRWPALRVAAVLYVLPWLFFLWKATHSRVEANWGVVAFLTLWPLAAVWYRQVRASRMWRLLAWSSFILPVGTIVFLGVHVVEPWWFIPPKQDRLTRQASIQRNFQELAGEIRRLDPTLPVFSDHYQDVAWLRYFGIPAEQLAEGSRPSHFTQVPRGMTGMPAAWMVLRQQSIVPQLQGLVAEVPVVTLSITVRGELIGPMFLVRYVRPADESVSAEE